MIAIRKAKESDLRYLALLFDRYRVFYEKESNVDAAQKFLAARMERNESVIFVADAKEKNLVGFVQLYPLFSSTRMKRLWLLNDLYVEESHRGKGISKQLIEAAKMLCEETDACGLILETAKSNTVGNALYPSAGFALDADHNYYSWSR